MKKKKVKFETYVSNIGDNVVRTIKIIEYKLFLIASVKEVRNGDEENAICSYKRFYRTSATPTNKSIKEEIFKWYNINENDKIES